MTATAAPAAKYPRVQNYIAGSFVPTNGRTLEVVNPADGSVFAWGRELPASAGAGLPRSGKSERWDRRRVR